MSLVNLYKAVADESRLRLVHILSHGYFSVQELTSVLKLRQPTVSHHLRVLQQAGITKLQREGTWAFYTIAADSSQKQIGAFLLSFLELIHSEERSLKELLEKDEKALAAVIAGRRDHSTKFFDSVAKKWNELRHEALGPEPFLESLLRRIPEKETLLELGRGTGTLLTKLLPRSGRSIGVDASPAMLEEARQTLSQYSANVDLRLGYLEHLPIPNAEIDTALAYMVLHHVPVPQEALADAARVLKRTGRLIVVDLNKHGNEELRQKFADLWLGFDPNQVSNWAEAAGLAAEQLEFFGEKQEVFILTLIKKGEKA